MNYNPFARTRSREQAYDEDSLTRVRSETSHVPAIQETRVEVGEAAKAFEATDDHPGFIEEHSELSENSTQLEIDIGHITITERQDDLSPEERYRRDCKRKIPLKDQLHYVASHSWPAIALFPLVPAGFALRYAHANAVAVFCINFGAIFPCTAMLGTAVYQLSIRFGDNVGALLSMTFGNAVQFILSALLLKSRQISVLKLSLLGAIFSNLLLTSGLSFFLGAYGDIEQYFNAQVTQTIGGLLFLAVMSLLVPSAPHLIKDCPPASILALSRGISVVIFGTYIAWLVFQLSTHKEWFSAPSMKAKKRSTNRKYAGNAQIGVAAIGAGTAAASGGGINLKKLLQAPDDEDDDDALKTPSLSVIGAAVTLTVSVVLVAFNTEFATDSIQGILHRRKVSQTFLSLIILPILSCDPLAIQMAIQDKMNISISLTLERCMQTALLIIPLTMFVAMLMGVHEMDLQFNGFIIASLLVSIAMVSYVVQRDTSNWLTGVLLLQIFFIIALTAFFLP